MQLMLSKINIENILKYVKNKSLKLHAAQRLAFQNCLVKAGPVKSEELCKLFGNPPSETQEFLKHFVKSSKVTPPRLMLSLRTHACTVQQLSKEANLPVEKVEKHLECLTSFRIIKKVTGVECLESYLVTLKDFTLSRFREHVLPWVKREGMSWDDLKKEDLWIASEPLLTFTHGIRRTGRELHIEYVNEAGKNFTEKHSTSPCLNEMLRLEFGLTPKITTFKKLENTTKSEVTFEDKFRSLVSAVVRKINHEAHCTEEEHDKDEGVLPDTLVTLPDKRSIALELKRSSQGFYVDASIKQFLRYLTVYDYVGIIGFHDLPSLASHLGGNTFTGEKLLTSLKEYFDKRIEERKKERNKYPRELSMDHPDFCAKVDATNTYLAYRYARKQLDKFNFKHESIEVLVGPDAFRVFEKDYKKKTDKVLLFIGGTTLAQKCSDLGLTEKLKEVKDFDEHLRELMKKSKV